MIRGWGVVFEKSQTFGFAASEGNAWGPVGRGT